jgi:prevent-host-death family protein
MVHRIQAAKARKHFASIVERSSQGERIKVTRYGRTLAAIIPKGDLEKLENCENDQLPDKQPKPAGARGEAAPGHHPPHSDGRGRR